MKHFEHLTYNTPHCRTSYRKEVSNDIIPVMKKMIAESLKTGKAEVLDGTYVWITTENGGRNYIATLFSDKDLKIPLLSTVGLQDKEAAEEIFAQWEQMYSNIKTADTKPLEHDFPMVCDLLFPTLIFRPDITKWTGDFTRCLAWGMWDK